MNVREFVLGELARRAYRVGNFSLKCGEPTSEIVDTSATLRTRVQLEALSLAFPLMETPNGVGGPMSAADPIAVAYMLANPSVYWCGVRGESKERGIRPGRIVGPIERGHTILAVEDVLTTGASLLDAIRVFRAAGCVVRHAFVLVDRSQFDARMRIEDEGVQLTSMFLLSEIRDVADRTAYISRG